MIAACVTKDFGVLATDSAMYDTDRAEMSFESQKMIIIGGKKMMTFIGTHLFLSMINKEKLMGPFDAACLYLKNHFKEIEPDVREQMASSIKDEDEQKPHFCLFLMGLHNNRPTLAQFNSFLGFSPKYLWTDGAPKFATILYGDDSKPEKQAMFKESTEYMEVKAKDHPDMSPGLVAEILTRGIYKKADMEEKIGLKKKYAGGIVNAAYVNRSGVMNLSGFTLI